jgi:hypothetical protein
MESIIDYLIRQLRDAGPRRWSAIAAEINADLPAGESIGEPLLRKIAYGDRENPGVKTVQPIVNYFTAVDRGERALPDAEMKVA